MVCLRVSYYSDLGCLDWVLASLKMAKIYLILLTLSTLPFSVNPFCVVWKHVPSSLSGCGVWNIASCIFGLNFSPLVLGSNLSKPCFFNVFSNTVSVILRPLCSSRRSLFVASETSASLSAGTAPRARSNVSMDSIKSLAKRCIAKSLAACTSRLVLFWRLRYSAT